MTKFRVYRVYTEDKGRFLDFETAEEAEDFAASKEGYHGPIIVIEDGEEAGFY